MDSRKMIDALFYLGTQAGLAEHRLSDSENNKIDSIVNMALASANAVSEEINLEKEVFINLISCRIGDKARKAYIKRKRSEESAEA